MFHLHIVKDNANGFGDFAARDGEVSLMTNSLYLKGDSNEV